MSDAPSYSPELSQKKTAAAAFLVSLLTSAKTAGLYKEGHPIIAQIGERMVNLLRRCLGADTTLTLDIKAKTVEIEESALPESPEVVGFAVALHTLGVGQILLTNRLEPAGMIEFFKVLTVKPDDKTSLSELQKWANGLRIDGLQMVFILSFVVTGETEQKEETPGQLSEEQIQAFLAARTLPDFLWLLLKQNENLQGKQAEAVAALLDDAVFRDIPLEKVEAEFPWSVYDERIRARWQELRRKMVWAPKSPRPRGGWDGDGVASWCSLYEQSDIDALAAHHAHDRATALGPSLAMAIRLLDGAPSENHRKYAGYAYVRLIGELARGGGIGRLIEELPRWVALMKGGPAEKAIVLQLRAKILNAITAERFVEHLAQNPDAAPAATTKAFCLFSGPEFVPLLLDQLRSVQDKEQRARFCALLTELARSLGDAAFVKALGDEDWFLVVNVIGILTELAKPEHVELVAPLLLSHGHRKVREAAVKFCAKFGGAVAADALATFVAASRYPEEVGKAVITLSQSTEPGVDKRLIAAFRATQAYESKVAICHALSRFPTHDSIELLTRTAKRSWYEIMSGLNKELRQAAHQALGEIKKEREGGKR